MKSLLKKPVTEPYTPKILAAIDAKEYHRAQQIMQDAAIDYFGRLQAAAVTIPAGDAALIIHLYRHMADELARNDPVAGELAETLKPIKLPPITYTRRPK